MSEARKPARLPPELGIEIFANAAWDTAMCDKSWLPSFTTTSRLVWAIVTPILYHTVVLTNDNLPRVQAALHSGNFALTKRAVCEIRVGRGERHPLRDVPALANALSAVEHFSGRETDHFILRHLSDGAFAPHHFTLILSDVFMSVKGIIQQTRSERDPTTRGIKHLHVVLNPYRRVWPLGVPRPDPTMLTHVILEPLIDHWNERLLDVLPFLLPCTSLERVLVRVPPDRVSRELTWRALDGIARARDEERIWVLDTPSDPERSVFDIDAAFDAEKWTAGKPLPRSPFPDRS